MKLGIRDRIFLLGVLPQQGDFVTLTIKADLIDKIKITQEEITAMDIKSENGNIVWNPQKEAALEVVLTELELKMIKDGLEKLNNDKKLTDETFNLYKKFNA